MARGGGAFDKFVNLINELEFSIIKSSQEESSQSRGNSTVLLLIENNRFIPTILK